MQRNAQPIEKFNQKTFTPADLLELQVFVLDYCNKKLEHPDKKNDLPALRQLKHEAEQLDFTAENLLAELSRLLNAVQHFIDQYSTDRRRHSCAELIDFLQKQCDKIEECEMTELTAISYALKNLSEHVNFSNDDILKRKKWGFTHASEMQASPHLLAYWLAAARQIEIDVAVPDNHLSRCTNSILRYIGGLQTGCEVVQLNSSPEDPESLRSLPLHFNRAFIRYANSLYFYDRSTGTLKNLYPHENELDHIDHILCVTDEVMPVTPTMLKAITDITLFSDHLCDEPLPDFKQGMQFFSPRNILVAFMDGVFNYFEARIDFQSEMIDVLSLILEKGIYEKIIGSIAEYIDDSTYGDIKPSKCFLESLMRIGYATTADELKAIRKKCRPVIDARGIELDKVDVETIINHTPGNPDSPSLTHSRQPSGQGITCAPTINKTQARSEKTVALRKNLESKGKEDADTKQVDGGVCSTADIAKQLHSSDEALHLANQLAEEKALVLAQQSDDNQPFISDTPSGESPRRKQQINLSDSDEYAPAHERWKPWQRVLFGIAIGVVASAILVGIAAALLYAGPLAHVALAAGITVTAHWAAAVGVAGVVGTLAGLPVVGAAVGFIAGLIWNRKTVKEMKQFQPSFVAQNQLPIAPGSVSVAGQSKQSSTGFLNRHSQSKQPQVDFTPDDQRKTAHL